MEGSYFINKLCSLDEPISGITVDNSSNIYFTTSKHVWTFKTDSSKLTPVILLSSPSRAIAWDGKDHLWILGQLGVASYSLSTGNIDSSLKRRGQERSIFDHPSHITIDNNGDIYISAYDWCVERVNMSAHTPQFFVDLPAHPAAGIAVSDDCNTIYYSYGSCIEKAQVTADRPVVTTLAGNFLDASFVDGPLTKARFEKLDGLIMENDNTLLVADTNGIRRIDIQEGEVTTPQDLAAIKQPICFTKDPTGNIYVGTGVGEIWKISTILESDIKASLNNLTTWKHIRLVLVGDSGAGKTSVVKWLKGEKFQADHVSTDSVEVSTTEVQSWQPANFDIRDYMTDVIKESRKSTQNPTAKLPTSQPSANNNNTNNGSTVFQKLFSYVTRSSPVDTPSTQTPLSSPIAPDILQTLRKKIALNSRVVQAFHVWDFAGQEEYYNTHHFFLCDPAVYLLVVDISKPVDASRLKFWLDSISFYVEHAPLILIGTHKDQVDKEKLESIMKHIENLTDHKITHSIAVSCKFDSPETMRALLASVVSSSEALQKKCKLSWMLFYDSLTRTNNNSSLGYLSMNETLQIAATFQMDEEQTKQALQFFHSTGFLLWHDEENLRHIVWTKPHDLVSVCRTVITALGLKPKIKHEEFLLLCQEGRLQQKLLKTLWQQYPDDLHPQFILLLQQFGLAFLDPAQVTNGMSECDLIIPSLVEADESIKLGNSVEIKSSIETVPPLGFSNRLVARILNFRNIGNVSWCQIFQGGCVFTRNKIRFLVKTSPGQVFIQASSSANVTFGEIIPTFQQLLEIVYLTAKSHKKTVKISTTTKCLICRKREVICDIQQEKIAVKNFTEGHFCCSDCRSKYDPDEIQACRIWGPGETAPPGQNEEILQRFSNSNLRVTDILTTEQHWDLLIAELDPPYDFWRKFGGHSLVNLPYRTLEKYQGIANHNPKFSPAKLIIMEWQHTSQATVTNLVRVLYDIGCNSALLVISNF